ncbi:MAG: hypothetical protein A4E31_01148 [Methanomassiliicoccales archaeon PtaU1.Bin030]|nr:MAG: hypothetical protein A4E31_01148 [Methanomassiliicoccales archaeon PtaU1.Bin030]
MAMTSCLVSASISLTLSSLTCSGVHFSVMVSAAASGMLPTAAWARARAASTSSWVRRRFSSENTAFISLFP